MNVVFSRGLNDESVTHMNSAVKDLFVRVLFVETSGSSMQDLDPFFFDLGRFE